MGWLFLHDTPDNPKKHLDNLLTGEGADGKSRTLKSVMVGATYYAAVEHSRPNNTLTVYAVVILTQRSRGGWGYKVIHENSGPEKSDCPTGILDLLTPTSVGWADDWRKRCRRSHDFRRNGPKPAAGMTVKYGTRGYRLDCPAGPGLGWNVTRDDGARFRMNARRLSEALRGLQQYP